MRRDDSGQKIMKPCDLKEFHLILGELLEDARVGEMNRFTQHGNISTFDHCYNVASLSQRINRRLHLKADEEALLKGAMLHDYFLYDWHIKGKAEGLHGFSHPRTALKNAERDFELNEIERDIIAKHMFPLTLRLPSFRETVLVTLADKWCAIAEMLRIDISSYLIHRVNFNIALANGEFELGETAGNLVSDAS